MSGFATTAIAVAGVLGGLVVGLGVPVLTSRESRRTAAAERQREIADQILSLWNAPPDLFGALTAPTSLERRNLYLFGLRLEDTTAQRACLEVVEKADTAGVARDELLDSWADMVATVAAVYRKAGR